MTQNAMMADNIALYETNTQIYGILRHNNGQYEAYAIADEPGLIPGAGKLGYAA